MFPIRLIGFILWCVASVAFALLYMLLCPYFMCDNPADEEYYNYLGNFDQFL